jgi:hypothetical protein
MQFRCLIAWLLFSIAALPATATEITKKIDKLDGEAALAYMTCALISQNVYLVVRNEGHSPKAKALASELASCRTAASQKVNPLVQDLKRQLISNSKADSALKEFYTYWRSELSNPVNESEHPETALRVMKEKLETVRTEAEW